MTPFSLDWFGFVALLLLTLALTFWAGVEACRITHKQRGLEVDRPLSDNLPDFVPDDWSAGVKQ